MKLNAETRILKAVIGILVDYPDKSALEQFLQNLAKLSPGYTLPTATDYINSHSSAYFHEAINRITKELQQLAVIEERRFRQGQDAAAQEDYESIENSEAGT